MPLSKLFENLANHYQSDVKFSEELTDMREIEQNILLVSYQELLQFNSTIDFIAPRAKGKNCTKGWPCGNTCLSSTRAKNCDKPLLGQARTYAGWLDMQTKKQPTGTTTKNKDSKKPKEKDILTALDEGVNAFSLGQKSGNIDRLIAVRDAIKEGKGIRFDVVSPGMLNDLAQNAKGADKFGKAADLAIAEVYKRLTEDQKEEFAKKIPEKGYLSTDYLTAKSSAYAVAKDVEERRKKQKTPQTTGDLFDDIFDDE